LARFPSFLSMVVRHRMAWLYNTLVGLSSVTRISCMPHVPKMVRMA